MGGQVSGCTLCARKDGREVEEQLGIDDKDAGPNLKKSKGIMKGSSNQLSNGKVCFLDTPSNGQTFKSLDFNKEKEALEDFRPSNLKHKGNLKNLEDNRSDAGAQNKTDHEFIFNIPIPNMQSIPTNIDTGKSKNLSYINPDDGSAISSNKVEKDMIKFNMNAIHEYTDRSNPCANYKSEVNRTAGSVKSTSKNYDKALLCQLKLNCITFSLKGKLWR